MVLYMLVYALLSGPAIEKIPILAKKIIFSDEAPFDLGGYVNKQNFAFGAQKTCTHTLKSRRTQNESLFGVDFGPGTIGPWARRGRYSQWRSLSGHVERIFVHRN